MTVRPPAAAPATPPAQPKFQRYTATPDGGSILIRSSPDSPGLVHATVPSPKLLDDLNAGRTSLGAHVAATIVGSDSSHRIGIAPGAKWIAARASGSATSGARPDSGIDTSHPALVTRSWGGSGVATAAVSGMVALLLQKHPKMSFDQVRQALREGSPNGYVSFNDALAAADRIMAAPPATAAATRP